MFAWGN